MEEIILLCIRVTKRDITKLPQGYYTMSALVYFKVICQSKIWLQKLCLLM